MIKKVYYDDFVDAFEAYGRSDNFSRSGLRALFDYLEQLENDTGEQIELDVIGLCCDFTEYESLEECLEAYDNINSRDELEESTTVIDTDSGSIIIHDF